jgi:hypothetical protein
MKKHLVKLIAFIFLAFIVFTPFTTIAQYDTDDPGRPGQIVGVQSVCRSDGLGQIICKIHELLNSIIPVLLALGVVYFIWGVVNYVIADDEEAKSKGKERILYGIIGLAIIVSVWGLVQILVTTFGLSASAPTLEVATGSGSSCRDSMADNPNLADLFGYVTCFIGKSVKKIRKPKASSL